MQKGCRHAREQALRETVLCGQDENALTQRGDAQVQAGRALRQPGASNMVGACFVFEHPADPNGKDFAALKDGLRGRFGEFWKKGLLGCRELARGEMLRWISGNEGQWKKSAACGLAREMFGLLNTLRMHASVLFGSGEGALCIAYSANFGRGKAFMMSRVSPRGRFGGFPSMKADGRKARPTV